MSTKVIHIFKLVCVIAVLSHPALLYCMGERLPEGENGAPDLSGTTQVVNEIRRIQEASGCRVGLYAWHLESNRAITFNGDARFPMASTYKIPIAYTLLDDRDHGELDLSQRIEIRPADMRPGSTALSARIQQNGNQFTVNELLDLMLTISDNTAADALLKLAGGPENVTRRMRELQITQMDINRSTLQMIAHTDGITDLPDTNNWEPGMYNQLKEKVPESLRQSAFQSFDTDPRDTATPMAMADLLNKVYQGNLLKSESRKLLLDLMARCKTGATRMKGMLPEFAPVAHKTGTLGGCAGDVGFITLPEDGGHVVLAVYVTGANQSYPKKERIIAHVSRAVYDFFLFNHTP